METINRQDLVLTMEEKSNILHARASGIRSRQNTQYLSMQVFNTALEKNLSRIFLDIRELVGDFGYLDIILLVKEVLRDLRGKGVNQVAITDIHRSTREGWFLEPVAQSQGINIRVFPDENSALKWLME